MRLLIGRRAFVLIAFAGAGSTLFGRRAAAQDSRELSIVLNDRRIDVTPAFITNGRVLALAGPANRSLPPLENGDRPALHPIQELFRQVRASFTYDSSSGFAAVTKGYMYPPPGGSATLWVKANRTWGRITSYTVTADGHSVQPRSPGERALGVAPSLAGGMLYVPLRPLLEFAGAYVEWVPERRTVSVRARPPSPHELRLEAEAQERIRKTSAAVQRSLENAAKTLP